MKNILCFGYRDWSRKIYKKLKKKYGSNINLIYVTENNNLDQFIDQYNPILIFFIGWSWIIKETIIKNYECVCLHPSPLPKYRGGSPIQHQIINGEKDSAVTLFKMDMGVDTGDILYQKKISLSGDLKNIFNRIIDVGYRGICKIIECDYKAAKQNNNDATFYKRRTPKMSEIKIEDFIKYTAEQLHNKIRALQRPYPNAFIYCKNGKKLFLQKSRIEEN